MESFCIFDKNNIANSHLAYSSITCYLDYVFDYNPQLLQKADNVANSYLLGGIIENKYLKRRASILRPKTWDFKNLQWSKDKVRKDEGNFIIKWDDRETYLWRINSYGNILALNKILYNTKTGEVLRADYSGLKDVAFFGEHLLPKHPNKNIMIVQEELTALLGTLALPKYLWLAIGHKRELTLKHFANLRRNFILVPISNEQANFWKPLVQDFRGAGMYEKFINDNINKRFIDCVKEDNNPLI